MNWLDNQLRSYLAAKGEGDRLLEADELEEANLKLQEAIETLDRVYRREHDETFKLLSRCWQALVDKNLALGDQYLEDEDYDQARERYHIALDLAQTKESKDEIRIKLGQTNPERATTGLAKLFEEVQANPDSPEVLYNFGTELALEGHFPQAVTYFEQLLKLTPEDGDAHMRLANALADCERFDDAERVYVRARELGVDESEIEFWLGRLDISRGHHGEAMRHLGRTLELCPEHLEAHRSLAHIRTVDGEYEKALQSFSRVLELDPEDSEAYFELGNLHELLGAVGKAREAWRRAVEVEPDGDFAVFAREKLEKTTAEGAES